MTTRTELVSYLDELLDLKAIPRDPSNNGLQVEGGDTIKKAYFAVDGSAELFEKAAQSDVDFIFVHHGISWADSLKRITGLNAKRIKPLIKNDISFYAAHLPLDAHSKLGHNAQLAEYIGLNDQQMFSPYAGVEIGVMGDLPKASTVEALASLYNDKVQSTAAIFGPTDKPVTKVGIISGAAGSGGIEDAIALGCDCFITGEVKHESFHLINELEIPVIALGHYCSEQPGVWAVMKDVQEKFGIECEYIDLPTGL